MFNITSYKQIKGGVVNKMEKKKLGNFRFRQISVYNVTIFITSTNKAMLSVYFSVRSV